MHKILIKLIQKISNLILEIRILLTYDFKIRDKNLLKEQELIFQKNGINRQNGMNKLISIQNKFQELSNDSNQLNSEHSVIFSSISLKKNCRKILEIGTYDGKNALLLSNLFPSSEIYTVDLRSDDPIFSETYNRLQSANRANFCENRDKILNKNKNISFIEMNSLKIKSLEKKFDLIWIDWAHGFPVVTIDILNSLEILNDKGIILCDDVYTNVIKEDAFYKSNSAYKTINILKLNEIITYSLFLKRIDKKSNQFKSEKKYIALIEKL